MGIGLPRAWFKVCRMQGKKKKKKNERTLRAQVAMRERERERERRKNIMRMDEKWRNKQRVSTS
jgi:hypothetical protein